MELKKLPVQVFLLNVTQKANSWSAGGGGCRCLLIILVFHPLHILENKVLLF